MERRASTRGFICEFTKSKENPGADSRCSISEKIIYRCGGVVPPGGGVADGVAEGPVGVVEGLIPDVLLGVRFDGPLIQGFVLLG